MHWMKDPKTGKRSVTLTMFFVAFVVAIIKLLFAGLVIQGFKFGVFSGTDFATVVGAMGSIYGFRKHTDKGVARVIPPQPIRKKKVTKKVSH